MFASNEIDVQNSDNNLSKSLASIKLTFLKTSRITSDIGTLAVAISMLKLNLNLLFCICFIFGDLPKKC